jgi:type I restriction enzyme R subunit
MSMMDGVLKISEPHNTTLGTVHRKDDIEEFCKVFFNPKEPQEQLQPILDRVVEVWNTKQELDQDDFRSTLQTYIRLYGFVSQLITFQDVELEKLYVFGRSLNRKLPKRRIQLPTEVIDAVDLESFRLDQTFEGSVTLTKKNGAASWGGVWFISFNVGHPGGLEEGCRNLL